MFALQSQMNLSKEYPQYSLKVRTEQNIELEISTDHRAKDTTGTYLSILEFHPFFNIVMIELF